MELVLALLIGVLTTASVWLMLSRNLVRFLFGLVLIGNVANLSIFTVGGLTAEAPPFVVDGTVASVAGTAAAAATTALEGTATVANPLPQALVLTAIVIGFGLVSFMLVLALSAWRTLGTVDVDEMCLSESGPNPSGTSAAALAADRADAAAAFPATPPRAPVRAPAQEPAE